MQILINTDYNGLRLSNNALERYNELSGTEYVKFLYVEEIGNHVKYLKYCNKPFYDHIPTILKSPDDPENWTSYDLDEIPRNDPNLIQVFLELGENFSDEHSYKNIEIPDDSIWSLQYDDVGGESVIVKTIKINREIVVEKYKDRYNCNDETINIVLNTLDVLRNDSDVVEIVEKYYE